MNGGKWVKSPVVLALLFVLLGANGIFAQGLPVGGTSGLLRMPTADLMLPGTFQTGVNWYEDEFSFSAVASLVRFLEVGVTTEGWDDLKLVLRAKARLLDETDWLPNTAIGVDFRGNEEFDVYAVMSKELGMPGFRVHGAFGTGAYRTAMLGFSAVLNPVVVQRTDRWSLPVTTAVLEYDGSGINAGAKMRLSDHWAAHLALVDFKAVGASVLYRFRF